MIDPALLERLRAGGQALDRGARGPTAEIAMLRAAGWLGDASSLGCASLCDRLVALGGASLPVARLYEGHVNALNLIAAHASPMQRDAIGDAVRRGALLGVWGADGERPVSIAGVGRQARLSGAKTYASGLGVVALAIVSVRTAEGLQMVLVDAREPARADLGGWDVDGMFGSASGTFACDGLPAGPAQILGRPDGMLTEPAYHGGVWRLAACYAGALQRLADLCRCANGHGLRDDPVAQARLGAIAIETQTALLWAREAAHVAEDPAKPTQTAISTALFAREACEQAAARLLNLAERQLGARMHHRGSEAGLIARDLRFFLRQAALDGKLALATQLWRAAAEPQYCNPACCTSLKEDDMPAKSKA
jgi:alkylation response protein AidB-like acyl-CoA dehydrogenase